MITIDSASGYIDIPKVNTYEELMEKLKQVLQINDELFQHLYFSYIDEEEQERIRLIPQIYDDFINQEEPKVSIGFLDNLNEEILDQLYDIIDANKKRFKDPEYLNELLAKSDSDKKEIILEEAKPEVNEEPKNEDNKEVIEIIKVEDRDKDKDKEEEAQIDAIELVKEEEIEADKEEDKEEVKEEDKKEDKEEDKEVVIQEIRVEEVKDGETEEIKEIENKEEKNDETKSIIFAPYNSYIEEKNNHLDSEIKIENNILEFDSKTQTLNENYESNNNYEVNNGVKVDNDLINNNNDNEGNKQEDVSIQNNNIASDENLDIKKKDSDNCFCLFGPESNNNDNVVSNEINNNEYDIFNSELNLKRFNDEFSKQINALEESMKHSNIEEYQKKNEENIFENNIKKIIESNVDDAKKDILNSILLETSKIVSQSKLNQKKSKNNYVHEGIKCNNCGAFPIVGIRYKCLECDNFNCCEKCEQEQSHPHLFYKIKKDKALKY